jgi:hypothetical protein
MPPPTHEQLLADLNAAFRQRIPAGTTIAAEAVKQAITGHEDDVPWLTANFSTLVENVQREAYRVYQQHEYAICRDIIPAQFFSMLRTDASANDALAIVGEYFPALDKFFLSLTQGRRTRAGNAFEYLLRELFTRLRYPYTARPTIGASVPDFVIPSIDLFNRNPIDAIIFTVKRTLRERWRQVVTEGTRGLGFFLATIDETVSGRDLEEMVNSRIYLVVPARIKAERYAAVPNVITFEYFFEHYLDPAMRRWGVATHTS